MATSRPRFMDSKPADFFIKWMSKINTFMYRRSDGEGFGSNFSGHPGGAADHDRAQDRTAQGQPALFPP